ncbi:MAG: isoaspartyl peptidase/L-asparaginase [Candidatus Marinimicrobia bacterium]|jgi:beta-aspartyl-peptidase (threonine type)|nr:isoaspartyl peptidase/L-asparaginase [Candidatus Neomarinimicrobiota bacterium]MDP7059799.1 isoaspartyl peptidase/L-asparaginase [Candidatus Neomarinimicrobiota bacterium]
MFKQLRRCQFRRTSTVLSLFLVWTVMATSCKEESSPATRFGLVIHGGAGTIKKEKMTAEREAAYEKALTGTLTLGHEILSKGGSAVEAVELVAKRLEDSPLFNAGKGAVFTSTGTNELDASIMDGKTLNAGAVATVKHIKNPITAARLVMEESPHVLLTGDGAEEFAREHDVEFVAPEYFYTDRRWKSYIKRKEKEVKRAAASTNEVDGDEKYGTVGVAALDGSGNLAAGTSTGGTTFKRFGRVSDSPIIGAGTYADNRTCAISGTGTGEYFIRLAIAHHISALMAYEGKSVQEACDIVIHEKLTGLGGDGGVIAIDWQGNIAFSFNTDGMYRGHVKGDGVAVVNIYGD